MEQGEEYHGTLDFFNKLRKIFNEFHAAGVTHRLESRKGEFTYRDAPYPKLIFEGNLQAKQFHIPAHLTQTVFYNNSYNNNNSSYWGHNSSDQHQQQQQQQR